MPRASVDSQIGPSTRGRFDGRRPRRPRSARPSLVSATIGWRAPYSAGRMSSVIPASMTTCRPPRSRTWRTRATSQPARATSARPGSMARRLGRRSAGIASSRAGSSRANALGPGTGLVERRRPGTRHRHRACRSPRARRRAARPPRGHAGRHPARRRPRRSCDPTCRWTPRGRTAPAACEPIALDEPGRLRLGHPELRATLADRQAGDGLGRDVRVEPVQDVEGRPVAAAEPGAPAIRVTTSASSADSRATHRSGRSGRAPPGPPPAGPHRSCRRLPA